MQELQNKGLELSNAHLVEADIWHNHSGKGDSGSLTPKGSGGGSTTPKSGSNGKKGVDPSSIAAGVETTAILLATLSPYLKKDEAKKAMKQEMRSVCGRKPLFGGGRRAAFFKCQNTYLKRKQAAMMAQYSIPSSQFDRQSERRGVGPVVWIVGGLLLAGGIATFLIIRLRKR